MSDGKDSGPIMPISGIIALLAVIGFTFFSQVPLKGTRPYSAEIQHESYDKVTARLWQDPFDAVLKHLEVLKKNNSHPSAATINLIDQRVQKHDSQNKLKNEIDNKRKKNGKVTILGVMVPGTEYAEDEENRMRQRYAVLSGLRSSQILPEDSEHIKFAFLKLDNNEQNNPHLLTEIMPYEWFINKSDKNDHVLLIWLNDKTFQNDPLPILSLLIYRLKMKAENVRIIGPWESQTLKKMLSELKKDKSVDIYQLIEKLKGLKIFSAFATADAENLLAENRTINDGDEDIKKLFKDKNIVFTRIIGSDKALAKTIVEELINRRVDFSNKDNTIILVSESDTLYAGFLHDVFHKELSKKIDETPKVEEIKGANLTCVSYLRGIDGNLPGEKEEKADKKEDANDQKNKSGFDLEKLEKPAGTSQYDYLRRQADNIYHGLQRRHRDVKAIGILGSDFHDKYLVLQAFHQRFPQAIYFTTDLDAMWMHPANLQWTRNLLVASYFDLSARKDPKNVNQEIVPSFRDSYQTSAFIAVQQAFSDEQQSDRKCKPKLFEIGNSRAVNLLQKTNNIKYILAQYIPAIRAISLIVVLVLLILFFTNKNVNHVIMLIWKHRIYFIIALFMITLIILLLYLFDKCIQPFFSCNPIMEEPFSFFDGISVWPSNLLRILAFILSVSFLHVSNKILKMNAEEIEKQFCFIAPAQKNSGYFKRMISYDFLKEYSDGTIAKLWEEYKTRNELKYRIVWVVIASIIYFVASFFVLKAFGFPSSPVRGVCSYIITLLMLMAAIVSFSFLFLYVFDTTRLCHQFIVNATGGKPNWLPESLAKCSYGSYGQDCQVDSNKQEQEKKEKIKEQQNMFLSEWMLVNLVAQRTKAVGKLIFYPLISWIIIYIARHSYFDNWNTTIGLTVIMTSSVVITWICALILRFDAENLRKASILRLKEQQMRIIISEDLKELKSQIELAIKEIQSIREGAFAPFSQHPVFRSVLLALSSIGGTYLMEYMNIFNF